MLILPSIVALVAVNYAADERPRAYGLIAAATAIAIGVGPIIGGLFTTYSLMALGIRERGRDRTGDPRPRTPDTRGAA